MDSRCENRWRSRCDEVIVLGDDDAAISIGKLDDLTVGGAIAGGEIERVHSVMTGRGKPPGEPAWQLRVDQKGHAAGGWIRLTWASRAAKASAARMSSRSRSS